MDIKSAIDSCMNGDMIWPSCENYAETIDGCKGVLSADMQACVKGNIFYHDWVLHKIEWDNPYDKMNANPILRITIAYDEVLLRINMYDVVAFEMHAGNMEEGYISYVEQVMWMMFNQKEHSLGEMGCNLAFGTCIYAQFRRADVECSIKGDAI